jgi:hypothetical protein
MKKFFFLFAFLGVFALTAEAQKKACCAAKGASADKVSCSSSAMVDAEKAAAADASIVKQVSNTGEVSYTRKETCPVTGKVSYSAVEYCTKSAKFINVSPSEKAASCTKAASATKVSATQKKACCAQGANKACCKPGEKTSGASTEASEEPKVKLVNNEEGH